MSCFTCTDQPGSFWRWSICTVTLLSPYWLHSNNVRICVLAWELLSDQTERISCKQKITGDHSHGAKIILVKTSFSNKDEKRTCCASFNYETLTKPNKVEVNSTSSEGHSSTEHFMIQLNIKHQPSSIWSQALRHTLQRAGFQSTTTQFSQQPPPLSAMAS